MSLLSPAQLTPALGGYCVCLLWLVVHVTFPCHRVNIVCFPLSSLGISSLRTLELPAKRDWWDMGKRGALGQEAF